MSQSNAAATIESTKDTSSSTAPHMLVRKSTPEGEVDRASTFGVRAVSTVGGNSPQTPPVHFASLLGHVSGSPSTQAAIMRQLQRRYGNTYVREVIQAKLEINQPGDPYEQEADRVAHQAVSAGTLSEIQRNRTGSAGTPSTNYQDKREGVVHLKPDSVPTTTSRPVADSLLSALGPGASLPPATRASFESRLGYDFSQVRIHTDDQAAESVQAINAQAYTRGRDVVFGAGQYAPETSAGQRLLAHELTHVVQQENGLAPPIIQRQAMTTDWQYEADRLTTRELTSAIQAIRAQLMTHIASTDESQQVAEKLRVFEQTLMLRQGDLTRFLEGINRSREGELTPDKLVQIHNSVDDLFVAGFMIGYATELPPGEVQDHWLQIVERWPEWLGGYEAGVPVGLYHGLAGFIQGIWMLVNLGFRLSPIEIQRTLIRHAWEFGTGPAAYIQERRREYEQLRKIAQALEEFAEEFAADPTIAMQWSGELGLALGQELADWVTADYLRQSPYDQGYIVGDIAGQIAFEVLLEIILALATEGIGNLLRGAGAVGQGTRAGGRVANFIRRMLESSPALRRLRRALAGAEDITDVSRTVPEGAGARSVSPDSPGGRGGAGEHRGATRESGALTTTPRGTPLSGGPQPIDLPPTTGESIVLQSPQETLSALPPFQPPLGAPQPISLPGGGSSDPRWLLSRSDELAYIQYSPDINPRAAWRMPRHARFTPPPGGGTVIDGPRQYTFDANRNLLEASTDQLTLGIRDPVMYQNLPGRQAHEDFGHLLGIDFGHIDARLGRHGGFRQAADINRPTGVGTPHWYNAERLALQQTLSLHTSGRPYRVVAQARGHVNGVPSETRIFVESEGNIAFDSGWIATH